MELLESKKLQKIVEQILDNRRKSHDIRWQMLLRDGSYAKAMGNTRMDDAASFGAINPVVDSEVADVVYSHQKYVSAVVRTSPQNTEDAILALLSATLKPSNIQRTMGKYMTMETQINLAFLWRNVTMLKSFDGLLLEFFVEFVTIILRLPPLSLSAVWNELNEKSQLDGKSSDTPDESSAILYPSTILSIPELGYLANDQDVDFHDPFALLVKLFETVEHYALTSTATSSSNKGLLLSVCLALAIKSGRVSLLLRTACWMHDNRHAIIDFDTAVLKDLEEAIAKSLQMSIASSADDNASSSQTLSASALPVTEAVMDESDLQAFASFNESLQIRRTEGCIALSFGKADHGKLGHGDTQVHRLVPTVIESLQHGGITKVASMSTYAIAIDSLGNPYVWGTGWLVLIIINFK